MVLTGRKYAFVMIGLAVAAAALVAGQNGRAEAHYFGAIKDIDNFEVVFAPYPDIPLAGSNSTYLNFSVLENGSNISNIYSALVISVKANKTVIDQLPYKQYEFSDI